MVDNLIMMMVLAIIGSMIGWITNIVALKLIFRPLRPIKIPVLGITVQGVIPKRKDEIASSIGQVVEKELIQAEDVLDTLLTDEKLDDLLIDLKEKIAILVDEKMSKFIIFSNFKPAIIKYINNIIETDGKKYIREGISQLSSQAAEEINISKIIEERINSFELVKIEKIILEITKKELKYIEYIGAILGFFIGIFQGILVLFF